MVDNRKGECLIKKVKTSWLIGLVLLLIWLGLYILGMLPFRPTLATETFSYYKNGERAILLLVPDKENEMGKALLRSYYQQGFSVYVAYDTNLTPLQAVFAEQKTLGLVAVEMQAIPLLQSLTNYKVVDMLILIDCRTDTQSLGFGSKFSFPILMLYNTQNQKISLSATLALYTKLQLEHLLPGKPVYLKSHESLWHSYERPIVSMVSDCLKFTADSYRMQPFVGWSVIRLWYLVLVLLAVYTMSGHKLHKTIR